MTGPTAGDDPGGAADALAGVSALQGHPTHDELVAAVAALLAAARRRTPGHAGPRRAAGGADDAWRATRLAALGQTPRFRRPGAPGAHRVDSAG